MAMRRSSGRQVCAGRAGRVLAAGLVLTCGVLMAGVVGVGALNAPALAAPEPDPVPRRWELTVEPGPLRVMSVTDAQGQSRLYYTMTYKVTNNTGEDRLFTPSFDLATDEGELMRSGRGVAPEVTREILARHENALLLDQISVVGMLLQGQENAKEGLAVWPVGSMHVRSLEVYAGGFSGETRTIEAFDPETKGTKRVILRKTLMLRFQPLGETRTTGPEGLPVAEQRWIMR